MPYPAPGNGSSFDFISLSFRAMAFLPPPARPPAPVYIASFFRSRSMLLPQAWGVFFSARVREYVCLFRPLYLLACLALALGWPNHCYLRSIVCPHLCDVMCAFEYASTGLVLQTD